MHRSAFMAVAHPVSAPEPALLEGVMLPGSRVEQARNLLLSCGPYMALGAAATACGSLQSPVSPLQCHHQEISTEECFSCLRSPERHL